MNKAIFLDRDGVLVKDTPYITSINQIEVLDGVKDALQSLKDMGYLLIVTTNQSAVGRGWCTIETLNSIHEYLNQELDYLIDYFFYCPHSPIENCNCRKPNPHMIEQAQEMFDIDLTQSYMIGDSENDMLFGKLSDCKTIGVQTGKNDFKKSADIIVSNLLSAVELICK